MRVLFLHSGDRVPSTRFRTLPFARRLREAGHRVRLASSFPQKYDHFPALGFRPSQWLKRLTRAANLVEAYLRRFDVIVIDRELFDSDSHAWEDRFRAAARAIVLDVDDGIFLRHPQKYEHLAGLADGVLAGNREIAEYTRPFNEHITIIPTCIDLSEYQMRMIPTASDHVPIVGWIGTTGNLPFLDVCAPALRRLAGRMPFELRLIAGESTPLSSIDLTGVNVRFIPWHGDTEVQELSQFDVGLMPLPEGQPWMRYKCGLKLLQYMAVGMPGVASPIGVNAEIVRHGENGFLASTDDEWESTLARLLSDPPLRQQLGQAARQTVEVDYSVEAHLSRYVTALKEAISQSQT